jgi:hypothetical protein
MFGREVLVVIYRRVLKCVAEPVLFSLSQSLGLQVSVIEGSAPQKNVNGLVRGQKDAIKLLKKTNAKRVYYIARSLDKDDHPFLEFHSNVKRL